MLAFIELIHKCNSNIFSALGLVNFGPSLNILVSTLLISCRYTGLKISPVPLQFQIPGYVTVRHHN